MHAIQTKDEEAPQDAAHWMIQMVKVRIMRRWSELKLMNRKLLVRIPKDNAHLIDLQWTDNQQAKLKTLVKNYPFRGTLEECRVHGLQLAYLWLVMRDTEDRNDISGQWYNAWPRDAWVDSAIIWCWREKLLPILVNEPTQYPEPDQHNKSREGLHPHQDRNENALPWCTSSEGSAILSCSWPNSSFEVVANQVFCGSCGYIPHVCRNGQC